MEKWKNYKEYYIHTKTWKQEEKLKVINELLKAKAEDLQKMEEWEKRRKAEHLTDKQAKMLFADDLKELKKLLKSYKPKAVEQLKEAKKKALESYEDIKQLKNIKEASFFITWTKNRGVYGYQCKCIARVLYENDAFKYYESEYTGGCGYDKSSSALSYALNEVAKILLIKNGKKILTDSNAHYNFYACEGLYFSYGVGISSYETMFKNMGYKVRTMYHPSEDITICIDKKRGAK